MTPKVLPEALIEELLAAAEKATPGPWYQTGAPWFRDGTGVLAGSPDGNVAYLIADTDDFSLPRDEYEGFPLGDKEDDARFIALANPQTISALIAEVKAARASASVDGPKLSSDALSFVFALLGADTPDEARDVWMRNQQARIAAHTEIQIALAAPATTPPPSRVLQDEGVVAWLVERPERDGKVSLYLPLLRSQEEADRYRRNNPDETLRPLYAAPPAILPSPTEGSVGVSEERVRSAITDRLAALSPAISGGWQPIETATKDGTRMLLAKIVGHPDHPTSLWWATVGAWSDKWNNWNDGIEPSGLVPPTHWMHISGRGVGLPTPLSGGGL